MGDSERWLILTRRFCCVVAVTPSGAVAQSRSLVLLQQPIESAQYRALRYARILEEADAVASVGSRGDAFDNAMAEALNSLYKHELIFLDGPCHGRSDVEAATAAWVHWFNTGRVHSMLDYQTPVEVESAYYDTVEPATAAA